MKENLKIALLAVIAITLAYGTFMAPDNSSASRRSASNNYKSPAATAATPASNVVAANPDISASLNANDFTQPQPQAQPAVPAGPPTSMAFGQNAHSFGTIEQNTENKHIFTFTNTGGNPLIISDAKGSCGCTVPKYPKEPIPPGETGEIEVVYKPGTQQGAQKKTVTITANTEPAVTTLTISADVQVPS